MAYGILVDQVPQRVLIGSGLTQWCYAKVWSETATGGIILSTMIPLRQMDLKGCQARRFNVLSLSNF